MHDNFVKYKYQTISHSGMTGGDMGKQIYPLEITYTGHDETEGHYMILFELYNGRSDIIISARNGLKEVSSQLLDKIKVLYNEDFIRQYDFVYTKGSFDKTLLCSSIETERRSDAIIIDNLSIDNPQNNTVDLKHSWSCDGEFWTQIENLPVKIHKFEYNESSEISFMTNNAVDISMPPNEENEKLLDLFEPPTTNSINSTRSTSWNLGGSASIGLGSEITSKNISLTGGYTFANSENRTKTLFMDIDGDGLNDKVYYDLSGNIKYQRLMYSSNGQIVFSDPISINNLDNLGYTYTDSHTGSLSASAIALNISGSMTWSKNFTNSYFTDINGDGLPDFINGETIYVNSLNTNNRVEFNAVVGSKIPIGGCPNNYITRKTKIDPSIYNTSLLEGFVDEVKFKRDLVRMWEAPFSGNIRIASNCTLIHSSSPYRDASTLADGVGISIQHNGNIIYSKIITSEEYGAFSTTKDINVNKGDKIYFRLESNDYRLYDNLDWNPVITYFNTDGTLTILDANKDANDKNQNVYSSEDDFFVNDRTDIQAPIDGKVKIEGRIWSTAQSDDIDFNINHSGVNIYNYNFVNGVDFDKSFVIIRDVNESDPLDFIAKTNTNINYDKINYDIKITYIESYNNDVDIDLNGNINNIEIYPRIKYNIYQNTINKSQRLTVNNNNVTVRAIINGIQPNSNGTITMSIKTDNKLLAERNITVTNGNIGQNIALSFINSNPTQDLIIEYFSNDVMFSNNTTSKALINGNYSNAGLYTYMEDSLWKFGNLYRGWGNFSYLGQKFNAVNGTFYPIVESALHYPSAFYNLEEDNDDDLNIDISSADFENMNFDDMNNLLTAGGVKPWETYFISMNADIENNKWKDIFQMSYITKEIISNSNVKLEKATETDNPINYTSYSSANPSSNTTGLTIKKHYLEKNNSWGWGINMLYNYGQSYNNSSSTFVTDYFDMNGDRYPDVIGITDIIYSLPNGDLIPSAISPTNYGYDLMSSNEGKGSSSSTNLPIVKQIKIGGIKADATIGPGNSDFTATSSTEITFIDINGDGLPDKFNNITGKARMNLGYKFGSWEDWGIDHTLESMSASSGNSLGISGNGEFNLWNFSWSGGLGNNYSDNNANSTNVDINGDGLQDIVMITSSGLAVRLNQGNGFNSENSIPGVAKFDNGNTLSSSVNTSATLGVTLLFIKLIGTAQYEYSSSRSIRDYSFMDVNNDGYVDIIKATANGYRVYYSQLQKVNLLNKITLPTEATYEFDYELTESSHNSPTRKWVMSTLTIDDGYSNDDNGVIVSEFEYNNPYYDRYNRVSYGFAQVKTKQMASTATTTAYRTTVENYKNDDINYKGRLESTYLLDENDKKQFETKYYYSYIDCEGPKTYEFPALFASEKLLYGSSGIAEITTRQEFIYDSYANIIKVIDKHNIATSDDDIESIISYELNTNKNILSLPKAIYVKHGNDLLRKKIATYDLSNAELLSLVQYNGNNTSTYTFEYDVYGNMTKLTLPENSNSESLIYESTFDPVLHSLPINISDVFGLSSSTVYDYRIQSPTHTTDVTGNSMNYEYYEDGTLKTVTGPNEIGNSTYSIFFEYYNQTAPSSSQPWARTIHYDPINNGNTFDNIIFTDKLGKVIQTKAKAIVNGNVKYVVSGKVEYDDYGRAIKSFQPIDIAYNSPTSFVQGLSFSNPTTIFYDVLNRKTKILLPDNTINLFEYGFGNDAFGKKQVMQKTINALNKETISYTNVLGKQTSIEDALNNITKFTYSPLGELLNSTDPEGNNTTYYYNDFGQLTKRNHPDAGITSYTYDGAGNLMTVQTANLATNEKFIKYNYSYNRLIHVEYPNSIGNDVYYEYGANNSGNQTGRLTKMQDASGVQTFKYGKMGELTENIHTFVVPGGELYTFKMAWQYDSWNRIKNITYPDGEVVNYAYNNAGALYSMQSVKGGNQYSFIQSIKYNKYGRKIEKVLGNGTISTYNYNNTTQRLSHLTTFDINGVSMQDIVYNYDDIGNINKVTNSANAILEIGGNYEYNYTYDDISRLTSANGFFTDYNGDNYNMFTSMQYSASGNISKKHMNSERLIAGNKIIINYTNNYNYTNNQPHTVSSIEDGSTTMYSMSWDANGNMTSLIDTRKGINRGMCWDEENRLTIVRDNDSHLSNYIYNAGGERVWKLTGAVERMSVNGKDFIDQAILNKTLYSSPYMVLTEKEYTKHYFAGSERITSKIGGGFKYCTIDPLVEFTIPINNDYNTIAEDLFKNMIYKEGQSIAQCSNGIEIELKPSFYYFIDLLYADIIEDEQYFYHGDHLGSSSWITDAGGYANQHLQYMPFGETFVDQRNTKHDVRFKFTGKERDAETGFDYFGARYYDSDISVWLSVDPLSELSPGISPYAYVNNNPIMLIDEWGLTPGPIRKFKQWLKRRKKGIKVKKIPHVTREVKFKKVVLANGRIDGSIDSKFIAKDGTFPIEKRHNLNQYLGNAESFKITFNTSTDISIIQKERNKEDKTVFSGNVREKETDWITLRSNHRRHFSINYEKVFILDKKLASVVAYYKRYQVSAIITASESYFRHLEKMADRDARKTEYLKGRSKTF